MNLFKKTGKNASTTELVGGFISNWAARCRADGASSGVFVLDGAKINDAELGGPQALLPLWAWHAENLYRYSIRPAGLGFQFDDEDDALLKRTVDLDGTDRGISEVLCFILEAAEDARQHLPRSASLPGSVELRGLVNQFAAQMGVIATADVSAEAPSAKLLVAN